MMEKVTNVITNVQNYFNERFNVTNVITNVQNYFNERFNQNKNLILRITGC